MSNSQPEITCPTSRRIPMWLKVLYTAFVAVMVPVYWRDYGPTNFLYFCDVAVFFTLAAVWTENSLFASMPAVGILAPQLLWMVDFLAECVGLPMTGMTAYMFDEQKPLFTRGLSLFHFWLPILIVWLVWRLRYDRRAFAAWGVVAWGLMLTCYFLMPAPPTPNPQIAPMPQIPPAICVHPRNLRTISVNQHEHRGLFGVLHKVLKLFLLRGRLFEIGGNIRHGFQ